MALALLVAAGCASSPPPPAEYLLSAQPPPAAGLHGHESVSVALNEVAVAAYLDREGIVVDSGDGRLRAARGHVWAEPLAQSLRRVLQSGIEQAAGMPVAARPLPGAATLIDVDIERLHGTEAGRVTLIATWLLRDGAGNLSARHRLVDSRLTQADGYPALVQAHEELLGRLAAAIADSLAD